MFRATRLAAVLAVAVLGAGCSSGSGGGDAGQGTPAPSVAPSAGFVSAGPPGGPFLPASQSFTITNSAATPLTWSVDLSQPWLAASKSGGSVPAGGQDGVLITIVGGATSALPPGPHGGEILFSGSGGWFTSCATTLTLANGAPALQCPSEDAIQLSLSAPFIWFDPDLNGGAHTWIFNGGEACKALVSHCGDTRTDALLLAQLRHLLVPGNEPTATGGFQDQKQLGASLMFLLAQQTPRIWDQLSASEQQRIATIIEACLLSAAFTSSDFNYQLMHAETPVDMLGTVSYPHGNPNYRNGIVGQVIVTTLFLGRDAADEFLADYDHAQFRAELSSAGLDNLVETFNATHPDAPTAAEIEASVNPGYVYHGIAHADLLDIYVDVTTFTYDRSVACAANPGNVGILGNNGLWGGYMFSNCGGLPDQGALGMLTEFDRWDGGGRRVSAHYSNDGWYVNNYIHVALLAMGEWQDTPDTQDVLSRLRVGTEDLLFKIDPGLSGGYYDFAHGNGTATPYLWSDEFGHTINASISRDVIYAYHGL